MWPPVPRSAQSCSSVSSSAERTATPTTSFEAVLTQYTPGLPGRKVVDDAPGIEDTRPAKPIPVTPLPPSHQDGPPRPDIVNEKDGGPSAVRTPSQLVCALRRRTLSGWSASPC